MKKEQAKKKRGLGGLWLYALFAALLIGCVTVGDVAAKYITARPEPQNLVLAEKFHFSSNYLTDEATAPEIRVNAGTGSVDIELYNYDDLLRVSELDIDYTLTVSEVTKADGSAAEAAVVSAATISPASGTLSAGPTTQTATVTLSGLQNGYNYTVTAVGRNRYVKTLSAVFKVDPTPAKVYMYLDTSNGNYVNLYVWTVGEIKGTATIHYTPWKYYPNGIDPVMTLWTISGGSGTDSWSFANYNSSHTYRFYRVNTQTPSQSDFTVSITDSGSGAVVNGEYSPLP